MSESQFAKPADDTVEPTDQSAINWDDWSASIALEEYEEPATLGWDALIIPSWQEPTRNSEIREGAISLPDGSVTIATRTWATVLRYQQRAFRVVNWERLAEKSEQEYARNDARYKILVGRNDSTNLTPSIFAYDPETCSIEMEFLEGISLSQIDQNIKIPIDVIQRFFDRLDRFHKLGLFHGDLTDTSHYIITPAGEIRLIDPSFMRDIETAEQVEKIQEMDRAVAKKILNQFAENRIQ